MIIFVFVMSNTYAFALLIPPELTVKTNKNDYVTGETIRVSGQIADEIKKTGEKLRIQVFNPNGQLYLSDSLNVKNVLLANGEYVYDFEIKGELALPGNYEIYVNYDRFQTANTFSYQIGNKNAEDYNTYVIPFDNIFYPVRYKTTDAKLQSIFADNYSNALAILVDSKGNSTLTIELPRKIIDAKNGTEDKNYIVDVGALGGMITSTNDFKEIQNTSDKRTLQINLDKYAALDDVMIMGTKMFSPENTNQTKLPNMILLPLKQFKSGITANEVKCNQHFSLIIKSEDGSPACVKYDTANILIERGWAKSS